MVWSQGLQLLGGGFYSSGVGNRRRFAEQINSTIMSARGNKVFSGCAPTVGTQTNLPTAGNHLNVASGTVIIAGVRYAFAGANVDLKSVHDALAVGQARYVLITIYNNAGTATLRSTAGTIANDGNQEPPETPEDETDIAIIYLEESDETMDTNNIGDWRQYTSQGELYGDNDKTVWGDSGDLSAYHDGTNSFIENITGDLILKTPTTKNIRLILGGAVTFRDVDDSEAILFNFDTSARTLTIGASADFVDFEIFGQMLISDILNSATETNITQLPLTGDNSLIVEADFISDNFYPMLFLTTDNSSGDRPVAGMWAQLTGSGSILKLGTSTSYATGINRYNLELNPDGSIKNPVDDAGY